MNFFSWFILNFDHLKVISSIIFIIWNYSIYFLIIYILFNGIISHLFPSILIIHLYFCQYNILLLNSLPFGLKTALTMFSNHFFSNLIKYYFFIDSFILVWNNSIYWVNLKSKLLSLWYLILMMRIFPIFFEHRKSWLIQKQCKCSESTIYFTI